MEFLNVLFENAEVMGIPLLLFVFGLVQWVKETFSLTGRAVRVSSMLIGLFLGVGYQFTVGTPADFAGWFGTIVFGIGLGLVASGGYDAMKQTSSK